MKHLLKKSALAAATLLSLGTAQAALIDFEGSLDSPFAPFAPLYTDGNEFYQSGYWIGFNSNAAATTPSDLVGAVVDASDISATCVGVTCPTNVTSGHFLAVLNDGYIAIGTMDGSAFTLNSFSASFIGVPGDTYSATRAGQIVIQGNRASGGSTAVSGSLALANASGAYSFASYNLTSLWANEKFSSILIYGRYCPATGSCTAFTTDKGQFAIDDINLTAVPEPATWGLMGLGLAGLAAARRRRSV